MKFKVTRKPHETDVSFEAETNQEEKDLRNAIVNATEIPGSGARVMPSIARIVEELGKLGYDVNA